MDKNQIRKEIAALINSIKEHSDNIGEKEHIPQLELELILMKIEKLYQKSIVFNYLNSSALSSEPPEMATISVKTEESREVPKKTEEPPVAKQEIKKPVDLFGAEVTTPEKPKTEKKVEKEEKKETKQEVNRIHKPSVTDIRSAIGINDKFQYMNELFQGNMQEYEIAIQQLNTAETLESALEYFMSIQQLYNWDNDTETVKRLFDLVERRYS